MASHVASTSRSASGARVVAQQVLERHRRRELRRPAEAAVHRVGVAGDEPRRAGERVVVERVGGEPRCRPRDGVGDRGALLRDGVAPLGPRLPDGVEQLAEVLPRVVGAAVERVAVGREEARHGPATLPRQRGRGRHVHRVDVGPLLAVDLHGHEAGVHGLRDTVVLERLVRHDVAPVARRVPDRQQDRHVATAGLGERVVAPLPPVHRVLRVLEKVRARRSREAVGHALHPRTTVATAARRGTRWTANGEASA
jgi:hypothetical protein